MLAETLRRLAPNLREIGLNVEFWRSADRQRTRMIKIEGASDASRLEAIHAARSELPPFSAR